MPIGSMIAVYFVLWWVALFAVLPFGVRNQEDTNEEIVVGTDPGAPAVLKLWPRMLAASILAGVLLFVVLWGFGHPFIQEYWG